MSEQLSAEQYVERASSFRDQEQWREAREAYQKAISKKLTPIDKAKMLANVMQMYEKEGNANAAIATGEQIIQEIQMNQLYHTNEGVHLRGFTNGSLRRLRGESFPWDLVFAMLSGYIVGAAFGAAIGARIEYEGLTISGMVWTDFRYGGAAIGAILGFLFLSPMLARFGLALSILGGTVNLALLFYLLLQENVKHGIVTLTVIFLPIILYVFFRVHQSRSQSVAEQGDAGDANVV